MYKMSACRAAWWLALSPHGKESRGPGFFVYGACFFPPVSAWVLSGYSSFLSQSIDMHLLQLPSDQCVIKWRDGWMSARLMWSSCFLCVSKGITNPHEGGRFHKTPTSNFLCMHMVCCVVVYENKKQFS